MQILAAAYLRRESRATEAVSRADTVHCWRFARASAPYLSFGFAKSALDNISSSEVARLKEAAKVYLGLTDDEIEEAVQAGALREVTYGDEEDD